MKSTHVQGLLFGIGVAVAACGGKSSADDDPIPDGKGQAAGGMSHGGDDSGGGGSDQVPSGGGDPGTGDGSGGSPSGGTGGVGVDVPDLGDNCSDSGAFACANGNDLLALICNADGVWEERSTCSSGEKCDSNPGPNVGICRVVLSECEEHGDDDFCEGDEVARCSPGGFEVEEVEACQGECLEGACLPVPDECPDENESSEDCVGDCASVEPRCNEETDTLCPSWQDDQLVSGDVDALTVRIPGADQLCTATRYSCDRKFFPLRLVTNDTGHVWRATFGPDWGAVPYDVSGFPLSSSVDECEKPIEKCIVVGPTENINAGILMVPLGEHSPPRNVLLERVAPGTECP